MKTRSGRNIIRFQTFWNRTYCVLEDGDREWLDWYDPNAKRVRHNSYQSSNIDFIKRYLELSTTKDIIDIGANHGQNVLEYSDMIIGSHKVYAFEAHPDTYDCLVETIKENNKIEKCITYNIALTNKEGIVSFTSMKADRLNRVATQTDKNVVQITAKKLDSFDINPTFIKIDVEGSEFDILKGAEQTIKSNRPIFQIEIIKKNMTPFGSAPQDIWNFFDNYGYYCFDNTGYYHPIYKEKVYNEKGTDPIGPGGRVNDYFFFPKEWPKLPDLPSTFDDLFLCE